MADQPLILQTDTSFTDLRHERDTLAQAGATLEVSDPPLVDEDAILAHPRLGEIAGIMVELAPITAAVLDSAPNCRIVARCGVGVDNVDLQAAAARGIWVTNVPGYATDTVSDHAFAMILAAVRSLFLTSAYVGAGMWRDTNVLTQPMLLTGRQLGIVGFGAIGQALARRGLAFGLGVVAYDPWVEDRAFERLGVQRLDLPELLASSNIISLHTALTDDTHNLLDAAAFAKMKRGTIVINTARGGLIDEVALLGALETGHVGSAGLDVFAEEPLPVEDPLRTHPRVIATPHVAFWSDGSEKVLRDTTLASVVAVLNGSEPENIVVRGASEDASASQTLTRRPGAPR